MSAYGETQEEAQNVTAFRTAEKKYQLHMEQQMRYRGGRMRGGKLVAQATDLSDVIDIRNTSAASTQAAFQVHQLPTQGSRQSHCAIMDGSCQSHSSCSNIQQPCHVSTEPWVCSPVQQQRPGYTTVLTFPAHPGLAVLPGALGPLQQLQLMRAALEQWPDPPTRTNHSKVYGCQLIGLYAAAQAGLSLMQQGSQYAAQDGSQATCGTSVSCHCNSNNHCSYHCPQHQQEAQQSSFTSSAGGHSAADCSQAHGCSNGRKHSCCSELSCSSCSTSASRGIGSPHGKGPKAAALLRKLRWASLGPPFNWTDRVYDHHVEYTPLPPELVSTASAYAALAAEAGRLSTGNNTTSSSNCPTDSNDRAAAAPGPMAAQLQPHQQPDASFRPDVALVNYYHTGDTLGGHRDDVEPDMSQPIVTMSLGCEAVFLMGGQSRDEEPTALLLRSGDVVVLGGPARSCYHGVPRIFTDKALPDDLGAAVEQHEEYRPYFEYFKQCRVNISVRMVV